MDIIRALCSWSKLLISIIIIIPNEIAKCTCRLFQNLHIQSLDILLIINKLCVTNCTTFWQSRIYIWTKTYTLHISRYSHFMSVIYFNQLSQGCGLFCVEVQKAIFAIMFTRNFSSQCEIHFRYAWVSEDSVNE